MKTKLEVLFQFILSSTERFPISSVHFSNWRKAFPDSFAVLIPGVQPASPSYHKREKRAKRAMINERRPPLPWIHLQKPLCRICGEALAQAAQTNSATESAEKDESFYSQPLFRLYSISFLLLLYLVLSTFRTLDVTRLVWLGQPPSFYWERSCFGINR